MRWLSVMLGALLTVGCGETDQAQEQITLATTTSTRDSGLLDVLIPRFTDQTGIEVKVVAVGSGQALEMGRRGDADVLLTHAPAAEQEFLAAGYGEQRQTVMFNDFVLLGPPDDPAEVSDQKILEAMTRIAERQTTFISRGDESGTHEKERSLWQAADVEPKQDWLLSAGSGMAATLRMASEKGAYTLSDRGTFLALQEELDLQIVSHKDPLLLNEYSVIRIPPQRHPHVRASAAEKFAAFLLAPETQEAIAEFGVEKSGEPLFFSAQHRSEESR